MKQFSKYVFISTAIIISSVLTILANFSRLGQPYLPTISEAAAHPDAYPIYAFGFLVGGIFMFKAFVLFIREKNLLQPKIGKLLVSVSVASLIYQALVPIDLTRDHDSHRAAAGVFFSSAFFILMWFMTYSDCSKKVTYLRRFVAFFFVVAVVRTIFIARKFDLSFSTFQEIRQNPEVMTAFAICQYFIVGVLFVWYMTLIE